MTMRIAYFVMLHHKAQQFEWLFNALYDRDDLFILHVDLKSVLNFKGRGGTYGGIRRLVRGLPNVILMRPRHTNWGGWSLAKVALDAIDLALDRDARWDYFVNLSGECYPIKPIADIRRALAADRRLNYVETRPFSDLPPGAWHPKRGRVIDTPAKIVILPGRRSPPATFGLDHKGSQWVMLTRAFCEWQRSSALRRDVERYMRWSPLTDEMVFQALLLNGPFKDRQAADHLREIKFVEPNAHAEVFDSADLPRLQASRALFARKFDASVDAAVLRRLADDLGFRRGPDPDAGEASPHRARPAA
jgi:hypothetical protein